MTINHPSGAAHEYFPLNDTIPVMDKPGGKVSQDWEDPLSENQRLAVEIAPDLEAVKVIESGLKKGEKGVISESISGQTFCGVHDVMIGVSDESVHGSDLEVVAFKDRRGNDRLTDESFGQPDVIRGLKNRFADMQAGEQQYLSARDGVDWESDQAQKILDGCDVELVSSVWLVVDSITGKQHLAECEQVPVTGSDGQDTGRVEDKFIGIIHPSGTEKMSPEEAMSAGINTYCVNKVPGGCRYHVVKKKKVEKAMTGREWLNRQALTFNKSAGEVHFSDCNHSSGKTMPYKEIQASTDRFRWGCSAGDCDCRARSISQDR
jgi:hypothetical protein